MCSIIDCKPCPVTKQIKLTYLLTYISTLDDRQGENLPVSTFRFAAIQQVFSFDFQQKMLLELVLSNLENREASHTNLHHLLEPELLVHPIYRGSSTG